MPSLAAVAFAAAAGVVGVAAVVTPIVGSLPDTAYTFPGLGTGALPGGTGAPVNYGTLNYQQLQYASATQCKYIENSFEDDFTVSLIESCLEGIPAANVSVVEVNAASSETVDGALDAAVTVKLLIITGNLNQLTEAFVQLDYCNAAELKASLGASVTDVKIYSAPVSVSNPSSLVPPTPVATAPPSSYTAAPSSTVTTAATLGGISSSTPTAAVQYALASSLGVPVSEVQIASFSGGSPDMCRVKPSETI
jgi:hypothetical protein